MNLRSAFQIPEKSTLPPAVRDTTAGVEVFAGGGSPSAGAHAGVAATVAAAMMKAQVRLFMRGTSFTLRRAHCRHDGPAEDAPNTSLPSARMIFRAFAILEPSLAREAVTVTSSPIFKDFLVHPALISPFGLPSSMFQLLTLPLSSLTSI